MPSRAPLWAGVVACALSVPSLAAAQDARVQDLVDLIVREGPRAAAIRADVEIAQREQSARLVFPNPGIAYSRESAGFTEFLQFEQPLPVFGIRGALERAGVAATAAAEAEGDARLWMLRADATRLAADLLAAQALAEATARYVTDIERLIEVLRVREKEGEGSRFDRVRAEQELAEVRRDAVDAAVLAANARAAVAAFLPPGAVVPRLTGDLFETRAVPDLDTLVVRARDSRAELRALQFTADRARREAEAATRARYPQPVVMGGLKRADNEGARQSGGVFGVSLAVPLFDTGEREAARWTAEATKTAAEQVAIEQQIRAEVAGAVEALRLRQEALADVPGVTGVEDLIGMAEVAYREGEVGIVTLLDAIRTATRIRVHEIGMRLDARLAQVALERAVGGVLWP